MPNCKFKKDQYNHYHANFTNQILLFSVGDNRSGYMSSLHFKDILLGELRNDKFFIDAFGMEHVKKIESAVDEFYWNDVDDTWKTFIKNLDEE